jgi:hypothetical protein
MPLTAGWESCFGWIAFSHDGLSGAATRLGGRPVMESVQCAAVALPKRFSM